MHNNSSTLLDINTIHDKIQTLSNILSSKMFLIKFNQHFVLHLASSQIFFLYLTRCLMFCSVFNKLHDNSLCARQKFPNDLFCI